MKLQQYITSFPVPLQAEDPNPLLRLLDLRNKLARGLKDTVGPIDVSQLSIPLCPSADELDKRFEHPGRTIGEPWDAIALRHCAAAHALHTNDFANASADPPILWL